MHNHDNPAKNWVRSWYMTAIDRTFTGRDHEPLHAVYFPGIQNFEGPLYAARGIITHPVERNKKILEKMRSPSNVFHGTLGEWIDHHAVSDTVRLSIANTDFEGQVNTCADEIIRLFRIFPAKTGGLLCITTFAGMDPESIESGVVSANAFDLMLEGRVRSSLHGLFDQLRPYLHESDNNEAVSHAQFCRDFGILWRVLMGLTLFTSPEKGCGVFDATIHHDLSIILGRMYQTAGRIHLLTKKGSFSFFEELHLRPLLSECRTPLFPLTIERILYRSTGNNRMSTWILTLGKLRSPLAITRIAEQLWQLYSRSPLTFVSPTGKVRSYQPR